LNPVVVLLAIGYFSVNLVYVYVLRSNKCWCQQTFCIGGILYCSECSRRSR